MDCERAALRAHEQRVAEENGRQHRHNPPYFRENVRPTFAPPRTLFRAKNQLVSQLRDRRRHDVDRALARVLLGVC